MEPGLRVRNLGPCRVGSRVKALTRLFDPDAVNISSLHLHVAVDIIEQDGSVTVHSAQCTLAHYTLTLTHTVHTNEQLLIERLCDVCVVAMHLVALIQ